jgi:hypothetical protein
MRRRRWLVPCLVALLVVVSGCSGPRPAPPPATRAAQVGPDGGSFVFGDTTVVVPPGAVAEPAALTVTEPATVGDPAAVPLGVSGALRLDIALAGGRVQPAVPLELQWRLPETVRAELRAGKLPLLYSAAADRAGFEMLPGVVDGDGFLTSQLPHLSLKWLAVLDPRNLVTGLAKVLDAGPVLEPPPADCAAEVDLPGRGRVTLGGTGWSRSRNSGIHPCLKVQGDGLLLQLRNNAFVNWPVRATAGVTLKTGYTTIDDAAVAAIVSMVPGTPPGQVTLPRGANVLAVVPAGALPAKVAAQPNPGPFLAEAVWFALNFLVGIALGTTPAETLELASKVIKALDVARCVQHYVAGLGAHAEGDFTAYVAKIIKALGSECGERLAQAGAALAGGKPPALWDKVWHRIETVASAFFDGLPIVLAGLDGAVRTAAGLVEITVTAATPAATRTTQPPATQAQPQPQPNPQPTQAAPAPVPVTHYSCANDNSNRGHYIPAGRYWQNAFTARGTRITGGFVLIGAAADGHSHTARVGIYGSAGLGVPLATVDVNTSGYDGETFALPQPLDVRPGQQLFLTVVGVGDFTAYDNVSGCFIGRVDGTS